MVSRVRHRQLMTYLGRLFATLHAAGPRAVVRHGNVDVSGDGLLDAPSAYAAGLRHRDIGPGKVVAVAAPTCADALAIHYACHAVGAAMAYLPDTTAWPRAKLIADVAPDLVVATPDGVDERTVPEFGEVPTVLAPEVRTQPDHGISASPPPDDLAMLSPFGGTTGAPKWCIRDFRSWTQVIDGPDAPTRRRLVNGPLANLSGVLAAPVTSSWRR